MQRLIKAFFYSLAGFHSAFKTEPAFRQELFLCLILVPVAIFMDVTIIQKILLIGSLFIVLITELTNTAIEVIIDYISLEKHDMAKKAKDVGSGIVLLALMNAVMVWALILINYQPYL